MNSTNKIPSPAPTDSTTLALLAVRSHLYLWSRSHSGIPLLTRVNSNRALRHWTIHRAFQLYQYNVRRKRELELERQYNAMNAACEALRLIDNHGLTAEERDKLGANATNGDAGKEMGRLYRIAMQKKGIWDGVPIEYARIQTESPPRNGWNHEWTR